MSRISQLRGRCPVKPSALVLCDDPWHPADGVRRGLEALGEMPYEFEYVADGTKWSRSLMGTRPVVIVAKANHVNSVDHRPWLTRQTQVAFREFVQHGGRLFLIHGGTCYRDLPEMRGLTGGAFVRHPDPCLVTVQPEPLHPLTKGVRPFVVRDEHYIMEFDAADAEVFLRTRSEHGTQPAGWTRQEGAGRVCALTPGHNPEVWLHPEFQRLLRYCLDWLTRNT